MVDWTITATTLFCEAVDDEVTVMVKDDFSASCTGCKRYSPSGKDAGLLRKKSKKLGRLLGCAGLDCAPVTDYTEKLRREEAGAAR